MPHLFIVIAYLDPSPIDRIRLFDWGIGVVRHVRLGRAAFSWGSWVELIKRARRAVGDRKVAARGRVRSNFSTARKVTMSAFGNSGPRRAERVSARSANTSMFVNVSARATSRRKAGSSPS